MNDLWLPDTNTLLRYLLRDHPGHYEQAKGFWDQVKTGERKAFLPEGVILETIYVLTKFYRVPRQEAAAQLLKLLQYGGLDPADTEIPEAGLLLFAKTGLDFVDCLLVARENRGLGRVFSFDEKLLKALHPLGKKNSSKV